MFKTFVTSAVVSKGYNDTPALNFSDSGKAVRFRIGKKVYDPKAENNQRWVNISVKAFGSVLERIKKMDLKEGSFLNISGTLDEEVWTDDKEVKHSQHVIIVDDIEYASGGSKPKSDNQNGENSQAAPASGQGDNPNFTGYEAPFGGSSAFFGKDE